MGEPVSHHHMPVLDLVRFVAALMVLCGHARGLVLVGIDRVTDPIAVIRAIYLFTGMQHEGVVLFFVVSGFLVGGSVWKQMASAQFRLAHYLLNRVARIYLVLIPALAVVAALDYVGSTYLADTRFYSERPLFPSGVASGWTWDQVPCHLLSVQSLFCEPWGADPPLWSLGFEWVFYLLAVPAFGLILLPMRITTRVVLGAATAGLFVMLHSVNFAFGQWAAIWLLGVAAAELRRKTDLPLIIGMAGVAVCIAALIISRAKLVHLDYTDAVAAFGLSVTLSCRRIADFNFRSMFINRGARFSYSLYLIHLPLCVFLGAALERLFAWPPALSQPSFISLSVFVFMICVSLLLSWIFARVTEDNTASVRRFIRNLLLIDIRKHLLIPFDETRNTC